MIPQLYKKFQEWSDGGSLYCYSDPHAVGRGLIDSDEVKMRRVFNYGSDELQINNINSIVKGKNDYLIFLGDIGDVSFLDNIKCKNLILIKGNHDSGNANYSKYFKEIYEGPLFISNKVVLSHEPMIKEIKSLELFNICGHIHNQSEIDKLHNEGYNNFVCISANLHNYMPINLGDLFNRKGEFKDFSGLSECEGIHRKVINHAIERKQRRNLGEFISF